MFNDTKYCSAFSVELIYQLNGCIHINKVIIRKFFTVELVEDLFQIAEENAGLVRVFRHSA